MLLGSVLLDRVQPNSVESRHPTTGRARYRPVAYFMPEKN